MSPVASDFASNTGSCNCGTTTVVISGTRSVQAARAPSRVNASGLPNAIRSPQHSDENGPSSIARAQFRSTPASRSGSMTGMVMPICTTVIVARRRPPRLPDSSPAYWDAVSLRARTGALGGGVVNKPPRTLPRAVRIATSSQVLSRPV